MRQSGCMETIVRDLMTTPAVTCASDGALSQAARTMQEAGTGSVIVTEQGKVVGILTERDLLRAAAAGGDSGDERVALWMTAHPGRPSAPTSESMPPGPASRRTTTGTCRWSRGTNWSASCRCGISWAWLRIRPSDETRGEGAARPGGRGDPPRRPLSAMSAARRASSTIGSTRRSSSQSRFPSRTRLAPPLPRCALPTAEESAAFTAEVAGAPAVAAGACGTAAAMLSTRGEPLQVLRSADIGPGCRVGLATHARPLAGRAA